MGNQQNHSSATVESRGLVEIVYSTTSGTSKLAADQLQELLQEHKYLAPVINIGDYQIDDLVNHEGTIIFLLSTYGDGSSPADGENFLEWIENLKPDQLFTKLDFAICAFGNSNFEKHCGFGVTVQKVLKECGGNQLIQLYKCDASANDRNMDARLPDFSKKLVEVLNAKNSLRQISKSALSTPFQAICEDRPGFNWQQNTQKMIHSLGQEFTHYWHMHKCRVVHLQQLRNRGKDGRSTLWARLEISKDIRLTPACNVQIFPINCLDTDPRDSQTVAFSEVKGKVPFPPMPLREIRKILDCRQKASNKQIKNALLLATADYSICQQYHNKLKEKVKIDISIEELIKQLKPKLQFLPLINLNRVRTYTLSSWDQEHRYLDLTVAITPKGLASTYFQTFPDYIRMRPIDSTFYIPEGRPLVMIANGSGIAPFRSIVQYIVSNKISLPYVRLYFGIQSDQVDYYFKQQWIQYEKNKVLQVKLAQSRKNPQVKQYVQNVLEKDKDWLQQHLFRNNGVVFLCGSGGMCKDVGNVIFNVVATEVKIPYKAFARVAQLKQQRTIVEEAFDS